MESYAEHESSDAAELHLVDVEVGVGLIDLRYALVIEFGTLLVVGDDMLAQSVVMEAGADMTAEIATETQLPGEGVLDAVNELGLVGALAADEEEIGTQTELGKRLEDVGELVTVVDTDEERNVEILGSLGRSGTLSKSVTIVSLDLVPLKISVYEGGYLAKADIEMVAGTCSNTEAGSSGGADVVLGKQGCRGKCIIAGKVGLTAKLCSGETAIEKNGGFELCVSIYSCKEKGDSHT